MTLNDNLWKTLQGGYKTNYDVSIPLKRLERTNNKEVVSNINSEMDDTLLLTALSMLATCNGQVKLGKAIMNLEPEELD